MKVASTLVAMAFKSFEHTGWQRSAGVYHDTFSRLTSKNIPSTMRAASLSDQSKVLDLACGPGLLTNAINQLGAQAIGVDFSEEMVGIARSSFPNAHFEVGDVEDLQFGDGSFDAAIMNFGLLHLENPETAIKEAKRVIKEGGKFVFTVWDKPDNAQGFQIALNAINELGSTDVDLPSAPPFFLFSDLDHSFTSLVSAGFKEPEQQTEHMTWDLKDGEEFFKAFYDGTARTGGLLQSQSDENIKQIKAKMIADVEAQFGMENGIQIPMPCLIYSAQA